MNMNPANPKENAMATEDEIREEAIIQRAIWAGHPPTDEERDVIDMLAYDERVPDASGVPTHVHSLDRCEHYIAGDEVGWTCGRFPMFTNIATANTSVEDIVDDADVVQIIYNDHTDTWEIVLMSREGGRLILARKRNGIEAEYWRDRFVEQLRSWFEDHTLAPAEPCSHLSATGVDQSEGPGKVWACDGCGFRFVQRVDEDGISHMIPTNR